MSYVSYAIYIMQFCFLYTTYVIWYAILETISYMSYKLTYNMCHISCNIYV